MQRSVAIMFVAALLCGFLHTLADEPQLSDRLPNGWSVDRVPVGRLGERIGTYMTIEGKRYDGPTLKVAKSRFFVVDAVNGKRLPKPRAIHTKNLVLPENERCVLKGYESGIMIGQPPAFEAAAKELGINPPAGPQAGWQWSSHFVVLIAQSPKGLKPKFPADLFQRR